MSKRVFFCLMVVLFGLTIARAVPADQKYPAGSPTRAIQDLDDLLDDYIISPQNDEERDFNRRLKKSALEGTFNIRQLATLALDKHWATLTPVQQDHFVNTLSQLLERKAVFAKEQGSAKGSSSKKDPASPYRVSYSGHQFIGGGEQKTLVKTWVHIPKENLKIELNYKLHSVEQKPLALVDPLLKKALPKPDAGASREWKIYDVIVDGASLLDNYKYQFDSIIRKGGYEDLIRRMESKLKDMMSKEADAL